jgi:hypothetical protein
MNFLFVSGSFEKESVFQESQVGDSARCRRGPIASAGWGGVYHEA